MVTLFINHFGQRLSLILPVFVKQADGDPDDEQSHGAQLAHLKRPGDVWQVVCRKGKSDFNND